MFAGPGVQYDRRIRYLDYYENGQRCRGAGFIKLERRDELCTISLQVSGLYRKDRFTRPFLLVGEHTEQELCKLQLAEGGVKICLEGLDSRNLGGQDISYDGLYGIRIPIADGKEIRCLWKRVPETGWEDKTPTDEPSTDEPPTDKSPADEPPAGYAGQKVFGQSKWEQLWLIYPHVRPFSDEREYLSVGPGDFVLLNSRSYRLIHNSFLLHGYYSYQHLILMRGGKRGQAGYYLGVPGNLYERDKKSAIMFGFESFEAAKEPAAEGDFGYYMIPVEL